MNDVVADAEGEQAGVAGVGLGIAAAGVFCLLAARPDVSADRMWIELAVLAGVAGVLIAQIGGKPAPAVGWAMGVERVLELVKEQGTVVPVPAPDAYAIVPDAVAMLLVLRTLEQLRDAGLLVQMHAEPVGRR